MIPDEIVCGVKVFVTENCGTFVARRKHKKRRIQKKWLKKYGKKFEPSRALIVAKLYGERIFLCHPKYWDRYKAIIDKINKNQIKNS